MLKIHKLHYKESFYRPMILLLPPPQALPEERLCLPNAFADKIVDEPPHRPEMA